MVILHSHRTQNMISKILSCCTSKFCLLCFFNNPPSLIHRITCLCSFFTCFAVLEEGIQPEPRAVLRPKWLFNMVTWGIKCATHARRAWAQNMAAVLVKSEQDTGSKYTENIYIYLKLIFAFAAQSSLSKVRNNNTRKHCLHVRDVPPHGRIRTAYTNLF